MQIIDNDFKESLSHEIESYPEGLVINIDKPWRWTSADVIRKVKFAATRHFGKKNLKVGHAGTLDPLATGVLAVCMGNACKKAEQIQASDKEYLATVCFGATTPSYDREKEIDRKFPVDGVNEKSLQICLKDFIGTQEQMAPLFSAKQVDGVRAYELARKKFASTESLDEIAASVLQVSRINVSKIDLVVFYPNGISGNRTIQGNIAVSDDAGLNANLKASARINVANVPEDLPMAKIRIACSKGTYVRALARDLGERLGSGAFLYDLERCRCGDFSIDKSCKLNDIINLLNN